MSAALDEQANQLYHFHLSAAPIGAPMLAVIDTLSGALIADLLIQGQTFFLFPFFDSQSAILYALGTGPSFSSMVSSLVTVDVQTAAATPVAANFPPFLVGKRIAYDAVRGIVHVEGRDIPVTGAQRLISIDATSGRVLSNPLYSGSPSVSLNVSPFFTLDVVDAGTPLRGRVTPAPDNHLVPFATRTLTFEAFGHAGDFYVPFVSCTPGNLGLPGGLSLPLAFDACSSLYFFSPFSSAIFSLTPSGNPVAVLPASELATGTITVPGLPPGLGFDLFVTFLTLDPALNFNGVHGMAIMRVSS